MKQNGAIHVRLSNGNISSTNYITINISNIDKLPPNNFTPTATSTTSSITLTGETTDANSGIKAYYFSKDNGSTWQGGSTKTSHTFTGLTQGTTYSLKMKAVDNAGNETITGAISKETEKIESLTESNTKFEYNPATYTRENVNITITTTVSGYTLQYSLNGTSWTNYVGPVTRSENGPIYARVVDSTGQAATGYATGNVTKIDKLPPNNFTPTATSTTNSITLSGSTQDAASTSTNTSSGIKAYYFSKDNGASWQGGNTSTSYTYTGLSQGTTYNLKMKAVDNADNETITGIISKTTETVPGINSTNSKIIYSPSTQTSGNVSVTITTTISGYTIQYSQNAINWTNYTGPITMTKNGPVYARVIDSSGQFATEYLTGNVTNIDKLPPNQFTPTATSDASSITLSGSTQDAATTSEYTSSGIKAYYFSKDDGASWVGGSSATSYTFTGLAEGTSYNLKMKAVDNAGNERITNRVVKQTLSILPKFSYTGKYEVVNDNDTPYVKGNKNWKVRFLTSGTLTMNCDATIDVFLVGGGAGGEGGADYTPEGIKQSCQGGSGGFTNTIKKVRLVTGQSYQITIGNGGAGSPYHNRPAVGSGGRTTAFGNYAEGGYGLGTNRPAYEFGGNSGQIYGKVGISNMNGSGAQNSGNGGNGAIAAHGGTTGGTGGSGIVVIRNAR